MSSRNYIEINLDTIKEDLAGLKALAPGRKIFGVMKANSYGLGAQVIAKEIEDEVDFFCVALPEEAQELIEHHVRKPILCLGYLPDEWMDYYVEFHVRPAIFTVEAAEKLNAIAKEKGTIAPVHIALDTGHTRVGFMWDDPEVFEKIGKVSRMENLHIEGMFSHFATADEEETSFMYAQRDRYLQVSNGLKERGIDIGIRHLANDAGVLRAEEETLMDGVRLGISLYGESPSPYMTEFIQAHKSMDLKPVFQWYAAINNVKKVKAGVPVSYGGTWTTPRESIIATVQTGYADGYNRLLSNKGTIIVGGKKCPIAGRVCMDQVMVDVTDVPDVKIGDQVILLGKDPKTGAEISAQEMADLCGTINYEIMTDISSRVDRRYIGKTKSFG